MAPSVVQLEVGAASASAGPVPRRSRPSAASGHPTQGGARVVRTCWTRTSLPTTATTLLAGRVPVGRAGRRGGAGCRVRVCRAGELIGGRGCSRRAGELVGGGGRNPVEVPRIRMQVRGRMGRSGRAVVLLPGDADGAPHHESDAGRESGDERRALVASGGDGGHLMILESRPASPASRPRTLQLRHVRLRLAKSYFGLTSWPGPHLLGVHQRPVGFARLRAPRWATQ